MKFRPCIDIHNGKVKQIVGATLSDEESSLLKENFVSDMTAAHFADMYRKKGLDGGHAIILDKAGTDGYETSKKEILKALSAWPGGLQVGGGMNNENAGEFLDAGASHIIVTSFVFRDGKIDMDRLSLMREALGAKRLVLDLSVKAVNGAYHVVTDRWQKISDEILEKKLFKRLSGYCSEFLVHAADVEGRKEGVDKSLLKVLSYWDESPVTYAGGIGSIKDIEYIKEIGKERIDYTVGSALDIFGGNLEFSKVCNL